MVPSQACTQLNCDPLYSFKSISGKKYSNPKKILSWRYITLKKALGRIGAHITEKSLNFRQKGKRCKKLSRFSATKYIYTRAFCHKNLTLIKMGWPAQFIFHYFLWVSKMKLKGDANFLRDGWVHTISKGKGASHCQNWKMWAPTPKSKNH